MSYAQKISELKLEDGFSGHYHNGFIIAREQAALIASEADTKIQELTKIQCDKPVYVPFDKLCLGAKFRYDPRRYKLHAEDGITRVWVKICVNEIALWEEDNLTTNWVGQQICCFSDTDDLNEEVQLVNQGIRS